MRKVLTLFIVSLISITACSSKKNQTKVKHVGHEQEWDREKINETMQYEEAAKPSKEQVKKWKDQESDCKVMSKAQMIKANASTCHPLDPQDGYGDNMFCCDKEDD